MKNLIIGGSLFLALIGYLTDSTEFSFYCLNLGGALFTIWVFFYLRDRNQLNIISRVILWISALGIISFLYYFLTAPDDGIYNDYYSLHAFDYSRLISLSNTIPALSVLVVSVFFRKSNDDFTLPQYPSRQMQWFSVVVAANTLVYNLLLGIGNFGPLNYMVSVTHSALFLFSFYVGYWNRQLGFAFWISLAATSIEIVISVLSGGRFAAFLSMGLYLTGYIFSISGSKRNILITIVILLFPLVYYLVGVMGVVRDEIGRTTLALKTEGRSELYWSTFNNVLTGNTNYTDKELEAAGKGRNINWPSLAVVALSPETIPYVGFVNFENEFNAIFTIEGVSGGTALEEIQEARVSQIETGLSTGMANNYGYMVTKENSVEWGLLADSWSKGGPLMYFVLYSILFLLFCLAENLVSRLSDFHFLIYFIVLVNIVWLISGSLPFYFTVRALILNFILITGLLVVFNFFVNEREGRNYGRGNG